MIDVLIEVPEAKVFRAITPENAGTGDEVLRYTNLESSVVRHAVDHAARSHRMWDAEPGSLEELYAAQELASEYLVRTAHELNYPGSNRELWAERFTQASTERYGQPDTEDVSQMFTREYWRLQELRGDERVTVGLLDYVLDAIRPFVVEKDGVVPAKVEQKKDTDNLEIFANAVRKKFQPLLDIVELSDVDLYNPEELVVLFGESIVWMTENNDESWADWRVELVVDTSSVSVDSEGKVFRVGQKRQNASKQEAIELLFHELMIHALRANNGYRSGDKMMARGLPENADAEEGLAKIVGELISRNEPSTESDSFFGIALALGTVDKVQRSRRHVTEVSLARRLINDQLTGSNTMWADNFQENLSRSRKVVDRIYRGGPGDDESTQQAIFTKDIAYFVGYAKMRKYICEQIESGVDPIVLFEYLTSGKFDPTNPRHVSRVKSLALN